MTATPSTLTTPTAPGSLGRPIPAEEAQHYLRGLGAWVQGRRAELDEIDAAALAAGRAAEVTSDMALSMALWQAVSQRHRLLQVTFDGGRVGPQQAEQLSALVWGRLDGAATPGLDGALAVSVPEACRLSDALAAQLRTRLALVPGAGAAAARIRDLRAQLERLRDQVALEPAATREAAATRWALLRRRLDDLTDRAGRGADVGGLLGPLEADTALCERDLIVGGARRRAARDQVAALRELRRGLQAREAALTGLAATCRATVSPAPRYAVPDVDALGPVPNTAAALAPYEARLERVAQALTLAQEAYAAALDEYGDLVALLEAHVGRARRHDLADQADLRASAERAREVLDRRPCPVGVARQLVTTYRSWLDQLTEEPA